jgi:hypothetical protein
MTMKDATPRTPLSAGKALASIKGEGVDVVYSTSLRFAMVI